jgi:thiosulfate/3-mercaptopyruvate sulfurtransferase
MINNSRSRLILVDTRSFNEYSQGHIPSAVNIDLMQFHWLDTTKQGILQFNRQMKLLLNYLGINSSSIVVFYDNISGPTASRGVWLLNYFSLQKVFILDGGFKYWTKLNYPVETTTNPFKHDKSNFSINKSVLADVQYVKDSINSDKDLVIIDCRSEAEYRGIVARAFHRGHIPKSKNVDWIYNLKNENFLEFDKLEKFYSFIPKQTEIVTYCQGGYRAANTYLILKYLGYKNVKMYLGSWGEWGNNPRLPVE